MPAQTVADLGKAFKLSQNGAYDDVDDASIGRAVKAKHPGAYDDFEEVPGPGRGGQTATPAPAEPPSALQRFGSALYDSTIGPLKHVFDVGGMKALDEMGTGTLENLKEYSRNPTPGNYVRAVPLIGPPLADIGHNVKAGDYASALGSATGIGVATVAPEALTRVLPGSAAVGPILRDVNNPVERSALNYAQSKGIPMTAGQRTGQQGVQRAEQSLENFPGSANRVGDFYRDQRSSLSSEAQRLAKSASPVSTNPYETGRGIQQQLKQNINNLKSQADTAYNDVRTEAAANQKTHQVGVKPIMVPDPKTGTMVPMVDPNGAPIGTPIMKTFESPVDLLPVKLQLRPIYEDLQRSLPIARQQNSPAFAVLSDIMRRRIDATGADGSLSERYMNAMDFDKALGAIKSLTRDGASPNLSTQSQGLTKQLIRAGEQEVQQSLPPGAFGKLQSARKLVRNYHDIDELLQDQHLEPAALYNNLVTGGDRTLDTLKALRQQAPQQVQTVGRTFLNGLVEKATREGGWGRSDGVAADWNRLGPETKKVLFGPQLTSDMDNFVLAAKRLTNNKNPSGSASTMAALYGYGSVGAAIASLLGGVFSGHPVAGLTGAATDLGSAYALPNAASRLLFTPGGARLVTQAITVPINSPAFKTAMGNLQKTFVAAQTLPKPPSDQVQ